MPIISKIGRRSLKTRTLVVLIYALLIAGATTTAYPFLLMIAGSSKSAVDVSETRLIPRFLTDDNVLWRKYSEGLFNENLDMMHQVYRVHTTSFEKVQPPAERNHKFLDAWKTFLAEADLPSYTYEVGYLLAGISRGVLPENARRIKRQLEERFGGDIGRLNQVMGTEFYNWNAFSVSPQGCLHRRQRILDTPFGAVRKTYNAARPLGERYYFSPDGFYLKYLKTRYGRSMEKYNQAHDTNYASWDQVHLDRTVPAGPERTDAERNDWEEFTRSLLNLLWLRADPAATTLYRNFLRAKYDNNTKALKRDYGVEDFPQVELVDEPGADGAVLSNWDAFLQGWIDPDTKTMHKLPAEMIRIYSTETRFQDWLRETYGTLAKLNAAVGTNYARWIDIVPPQQQLHYEHFLLRTAALRWEFVKRNFISVYDKLILHGRGLLNTAIYCTLAVLAALIVNPLAAYALSRYRPPSTYKILLFLMLTMAFPPMVTQIPVFLMLRNFHMLNTFWALILPGLANGFSIFLLKGFFDSLPKELYESAALDGAGEIRIFLQITMSLSKPILAVIALGSFTAAYSNFMFALLTCQDQKMWTLMVWMYQLQQQSGPGVIYASLLVAAIPTFLIFAFCQNIIMRGIVVPVEK